MKHISPYFLFFLTILSMAKRPDRFSKFWSFWPDLRYENCFCSRLCQKPVRSGFKIKIVLFSLLLYLLASAPISYAQGGDDEPAISPGTGLEPVIRFAHLTAEDGLAQNSVEAILQDSQGFIWIGTLDGLSRFDGYRFTTYKHDSGNPHSLSNNHIHDIFEDRDGIIWVATDSGGLNRFDPQTETFRHYRHDPETPNSLGGDVIFSIFQDSKGNLWFGGPPFSGLNKFDPATETFSRYMPDPNRPDGFRGGGIWKMVEDEAGQLWLAADFALVKFEPDTERFTHYPLGPDERRLAALWQDSAGNLWVGGFSGLHKFNPQTEQFTSYQLGLERVNNLLEDGRGMFWISTHGDGLYLFDPQTEQVRQQYGSDPTDEHSLSDNRVTALYQDKAGVIWAGTADRGLNLFDPGQSRFAYYRRQPNRPHSLAEGTVEGLVGDEQQVWLGTGDILNHIGMDSGQVRHYTSEFPPGQTPTIHTLYRDRAGIIWLGLSNKLLYSFDPAMDKFTPYELPDEALPASLGLPPGAPGPPMEVVGIHEDDSRALWIAAIRDGLYRLDPQRETFQVYRQRPGTFAKVDSPDTIAANEISALTGDRAGNIWLGYINGGVSRLDPERLTFTHYFPEPDVGWIEAIYIDQSGLVWLAARQGLTRFDPEAQTFKQYTEQDGLPSAFVVGILEDRAGNLWLSTKKGLSKFDPGHETFRNYDVADGLQGNEFMPRTAWQAADGRMFFGGTNGLTAFYPDQIEDNPYQPPVILTEFRLFNEPVLPGAESLLPQPIWETEQLTLNHNQNIISFEFAALSYNAPHKNRYRYQLAGFETGWNVADSSRRFATYTSLPAGDYLFRVQGSNSDGVWSEQEVALKLTVLPPWWETNWFRGTFLAGMVGLLFGGYRWRVHAIQQRNRRLEMEVAQRTRDLQERSQELRESEAQLRQAKEAAETANQSKSTFLANMSHELRSPLNAILGFAQIMRRDQYLSQETQENLGIIIRSGEHLLRLINQVLDISKIEAGRITLDETDFDLYRLLDDLEDMFSLKAVDKQVQLFYDRPHVLPRYIRTDEVKLRQVLINLLNNALKFTKEGGVTLRVGLRGQNSRALTVIHFEVEDTGPGISPHEMDKLFEPFVQTETGRQVQEGTGLGLPISHKFIQLMGGDLRVQSKIGQGTIFTFNIQVQVVDNIEIEHRISSVERRIIALEAGQPRYRILIVDDKWTNRQLLLKLLDPLGFELRQAENGQEAIDIWQEFEPHLIWMDMRMPVLDGFEATKRIKTTTKGRATAIIALTASSFEEDRAIILSAGCDDFVRKPFREEEIFQMMSKHIGVRYVYETLNGDGQDVDDSLNVKVEVLKSQISSLAPELLAQLIKGTELGDIEIVDQAIAKIHHHQPALAERLARFANNFEYGKILNLIQGGDK